MEDHYTFEVVKEEKAAETAATAPEVAKASISKK